MTSRWSILFLSSLLLLFFPWWLWLCFALLLSFKFPNYYELLIPAIWYDVIFGLPDIGWLWGSQFTLTIFVLVMVWLSGQFKKALIFYR